MLSSVLLNLSKSKNPYIKALSTCVFPYYFTEGFFKRCKPWSLNKPVVTLSFDVDFPEDAEALPILIKMLDQYSLNASFACIGVWVEKYPENHREIVTAGHEVFNHTYSHPNLFHPGYAYSNHDYLNKKRFVDLSDEEVFEEIKGCHEVCENLLDYSPKGFRVPHFGIYYQKRIYQALKRLGYTYSSSVSSLECASGWAPFEENGIYEFPISFCPRHPVTTFDSWHFVSQKRKKHRHGEMLQELEYLLDIIIAHNAYLNFYLDPREAIREELFGLFFERLARQDGFEVLPYETLVRRCF